MTEAARTKILRDRAPSTRARYVLYWMQQSQRAQFNPALEYAIDQGNELGLSVLVGFGLMDDYPEANARHYAFMLEGLAETARALAERGIKLVVRRGNPPDVAANLGLDAALVVCDRGYLRHQRAWRQTLCDSLDKRIIEIEGDVVVPIEEASEKAESAARTIRPKINRQCDRFVQNLSERSVDKSSLPLHTRTEVDLSDIPALVSKLAVDQSVGRVSRFIGGTAQARRRLEQFIRQNLEGYGSKRKDPSEPSTSELSPYLHFGQISPVEITLKIDRAKSGSGEDKESFLEELIVRRELAANFVYHTGNYDSFQCLPDWARRTLEEHKDDQRPHRYTRAELEGAETHDPYWNAAMQEMLKSGYMHNYMRMYWGKKILEWTNTPAYAYSTALYLNNKYFLDGRDPSSFANVAWLFGLHDRAWTERDIFGKVRYMNAAGLERKFDIEAYVHWVDALD